jgi:hypothetical protein
VQTDRVLVKCGLWLHIAFIGATLVAAGLIVLLEGEGKWLLALTLVCSGGILAALGCHRGRVVLDFEEQAPVVHNDAHAARSPIRNRVASSG